MTARTSLSFILCMLTLSLGVVAARYSARNRLRASDLDRRHHRCEFASRRNELRRAENERDEWLLLRGRENEYLDAEDGREEPGLAAAHQGPPDLAFRN